ncbi:MAG: VanZ family protein [Hydrogenoanaerobacterium sp.]
MSKKIIVFRVLFTIATVCTIIFIFSNSLQIAEVSSGKSEKVMFFLNGILEKLGVGLRFSETVVRKLAHMAEYAMLGFWATLTLRVYTRRVISHFSWPLLLGLAVPVADEFLQTLVQGRSGEVRDVIIDFAGVCAGALVGLFILLLVRMFNVLRRSKTEL